MPMSSGEKRITNSTNHNRDTRDSGVKKMMTIPPVKINTGLNTEVTSINGTVSNSPITKHSDMSIRTTKTIRSSATTMVKTAETRTTAETAAKNDKMLGKRTIQNAPKSRGTVVASQTRSKREKGNLFCCTCICLTG